MSSHRRYYVRRNPDEGDDTTAAVLWALGGVAVLGVIGYVIYRQTRPQTAAPSVAGGPAPPLSSETLPASDQVHESPPPAITPPTTQAAIIERARTTPAASFLTLTDRQESLTPEQLANFVAAIKVIAMYERSRDLATGRPSTYTGEFVHDVQALQATPFGQGLIRAGDRAGRLDHGTQAAVQSALAEAQRAFAAGEWNRPWPPAGV